MLRIADIYTHLYLAQANRLLAAEANIAWDGAATPPLPPLMAHFLRTGAVRVRVRG